MNDLIRPARFGGELLDEITQARPGQGAIFVWWLGQSGYVIKSSEGMIVIDLYLSEHLTTKYASTDKPHVRMTAAPFRGADLAGIDAILASHKHSDHLDPGTVPQLMEKSVRAQLIVPKALVSYAQSLIERREVGMTPTPTLPRKGGGDQNEPARVGARDQNGQGGVVGIDAGQTIEVAGFRIRAIPSAHEGLDTDANGHHLYLGFVVESEGLRLYHSGDTLAYDGLIDQLGPDRYDVLFLPINGSDPKRGVSGNMSASEAVDLASAIRPRFVVPHHYNMFTFNTVPVETFEAEARRLPEGVASKVLRCGERWEVGPWE